MCGRPEQSQRYLQEKVRWSNTFSLSLSLDELDSLFSPHRFFDKTKNEWEQREQFEKVAGKYDMVFMDYSTEEKVRNVVNESLVWTFPHKLWFVVH